MIDLVYFKPSKSGSQSEKLITNCKFYIQCFFVQKIRIGLFLNIRKYFVRIDIKIEIVYYILLTTNMEE